MPSNSFITEHVLQTLKEQLASVLALDNCTVTREHKYIDRTFPFRALHMTKKFGKNADEFFLDSNNERILNAELAEDLSLLVIKDYHSRKDISIEYGQSEDALSVADIYIHHPRCEIVVELETFRTKPFSNLIFIPAVCDSKRVIPLYVIQCFAPERQDTAALLTRRIGQWLNEKLDIHHFEYLSLDMPAPQSGIRYLLPKVSASRPKEHGVPVADIVELQRYTEGFCKNSLIPLIHTILTSVK